MNVPGMHELYAGSYRRLLGQLLVVTGSLAEAEDVVQEAFVRGIARPARVLGADDPEARLRTVAVDLARSRRRRAQRVVGLAPRLAQQPCEQDPDAHVLLLQALRRLPAGQREVIALHHLADLTVEQVALTLGIPTGTVTARLSRGRAALSALLVPEVPRPELEPLREAVDTVVSRAAPLDLGELERRAARRGRRRPALVVAVTTAVGAATALVVTGADDRRTGPDEALPTTSAATIIADGRLYGYAAHASGVVLTVWTTCEHEIDTTCGHAWRLGAGARPVATGVLSRDEAGAYADVQAGEGGFVIRHGRSDATVARRVALDGTGITSWLCRDVDPGLDPWRSAWEWNQVFDTAGTSCPDEREDGGRRGLPLGGPGAFTADGSLWAMVSDEGRASTRRSTLGRYDGTTWRYHELAAGHRSRESQIAAAGSAVVVLSPRGTSVTRDGGATWEEVTAPDVLARHLPFLVHQPADACCTTSTAFAGSSTLYVADVRGALWRSTDLATFSRVEAPGRVRGLESAGGDVLARLDGAEDLVRITAAGRVERLTVR